MDSKSQTKWGERTGLRSGDVALNSAEWWSSVRTVRVCNKQVSCYHIPQQCDDYTWLDHHSFDIKHRKSWEHTKILDYSIARVQWRRIPISSLLGIRDVKPHQRENQAIIDSYQCSRAQCQITVSNLFLNRTLRLRNTLLHEVSHRREQGVT